jgi:hypothetical protein
LRRRSRRADFQVGLLKPLCVASLQPEGLTDISQPRSGWNAERERSQVLKGRGNVLRRPFRDEKYFRMSVQALRAWLISGVASRQSEVSRPIFSTKQLCQGSKHPRTVRIWRRCQPRCRPYSTVGNRRHHSVVPAFQVRLIISRNKIHCRFFASALCWAGLFLSDEQASVD